MRAAMRDDGQMQITVTDQGVELSEDKIRNMIEPFGQIHKTSENAYEQGTGLGLPLAKAMVELHDGRFKVESGACVTMGF